MPMTSAVPARSGSRPAQRRNNVVLPDPFGPESSTISPVSTSRSAPASAGNCPSMHTAERRRTQDNQALRKRGRFRQKSTNGLAARRTACTTLQTSRYPRFVRRAIAAIGRTLVTLGLLILLFLAYQLWGTGIYTARAQESLKSDFAKAQEQYREDNPTVESTTPTTGRAAGTTTTVSPLRQGAPPPTPAEGDVMGIIKIPRIGLSMAFV